MRRWYCLLIVLLISSLFLTGSPSAQADTPQPSVQTPSPKLRGIEIPLAQPVPVLPVDSQPRPSLTLHVVVAPDPLELGATAVFTLTITNQATEQASELALTLPLPDGAEALPHPAAREGQGWHWSFPQLDGLTSVSVSAPLRLARRPAGDALVLEPQITAKELSLGVSGLGGALLSEASEVGQTSTTSAAPATLQSADAGVRVDVPADLFDRPLTLQHRSLPAAHDGLLARGIPVPSDLVAGKRSLTPFVLEAQDDRGRAVHQFKRPLTIRVRYTPQQLLARGIAPGDLSLFWFDEAQRHWVMLPTEVDQQSRIASAAVDHFSTFTLGDGSSPSKAFLPSLQGWQVSQFTGAASYSYAFEVPAGPAGIKPKLELNYSSSASDGNDGMRLKQQAGVLGKGWSLDVGSVTAREHVISGATGSALTSYTMTFDGRSHDLVRAEALVTNPNESDPTHWAWRPTDESFVRVRAVGNGTSWDHAASVSEGSTLQVDSGNFQDAGRGAIVNGVWQPRVRWQLWAKDGTRYDFNADLWSGWNKCATLNEMQFRPYKWLLTGVTDAHGNSITYNYARQTWIGWQEGCDNVRKGRGTVDRDAWPTEILWAGGRYRVVVNSTGRTNDNEFEAPGGQYGNNGGASSEGTPRQTRQITGLRVESNSGGGWQLIREYRFGQDYSLYSDLRDCPSTCGPRTNHRKLTLTSVQEFGADGQTALPATTFHYRTDGGTAYIAAGGWQRLEQADNGQGGTITFGYTNLEAATGNGLFQNRHRVASRTLNDGQGNTTTWTYEYGTPAMNSLGTVLGSAGPNSYPNSAVLYLNTYFDTLHPYHSWLAQPPLKEFRGHPWVRETSPEGDTTTRWFYQGDVGCYPGQSAGQPLRGQLIYNDSCFIQMRNREALKGREWKQEARNAGASAPLEETETSFGVTFFDYGPEPRMGLWRLWSYETQQVKRTLEGGGTARTRTTSYSYEPTHGNRTLVEERNETGALVRATTQSYVTRNDGLNAQGQWGSYLVDRVCQTVVRNAANEIVSLSATFYDGSASPCANLGASGRITRQSTVLDIPAGVTSTQGLTLHGRDETYGYDAWGNRTNTTVYTGASTRTFNGTAVTYSAPQGSARTSTTEYDTTFRAFPIKAVNPAGHTEWAEYDYRMGTLLKVVGPNATPGTVTCGSANSYSININTEITCAQYDLFGRMVTLVRPGDSTDTPTRRFIYFDSERPFRYLILNFGSDVSSDPQQEEILFYDGLGRNIQTKRESLGWGAQSIISDMRYGSDDQVVQESQPRTAVEVGPAFWGYTAPGNNLHRPTTTDYDARGRVTSVTLPDGSQTKHVYSVGLSGATITTVQDARQHQIRQIADSLGRPIAVEQFSGTGSASSPYVSDGTTTYAYDSLDRLSLVTDALGNQTRITYDSGSRRTELVDPDTGTWLYGYDVNGNLTSQTDNRNVTTWFAYDALNRLTEQSFSDGTPSLYFGYDTMGTQGIGRRTTACGYVTTLCELWQHWDYDGRGRVVRAGQGVTGYAHAVRTGYDRADREVSLTYEPTNEVVSTGYDAGGRPTRLCSSLGGCFVQNGIYDALDQPLRLELGNGMVRQASYSDPLARLQSLNITTSGGTTFLNHSYGYDPVGNITSISDPLLPETQTFQYDHLDRLTRATAGGGSPYPFDETYQYDRIGNMVQRGGVAQQHGSTLASTGIGPRQLRKVGNRTLIYNANGSLTEHTQGTTTANAGQRYFWSGRNQLVQVDGLTTTTSGGTTATSATVLEQYRYDPDGQRYLRTAGSQSTVYAWGLWEEVLSVSQKKLYRFNGQIVAQREGSGAVTYLHHDHLGSVALTTDALGNTPQRQHYNAWGQVRVGSAPATTLNYTGQRLDGTGLLYYNARYYNPVLGRFISADALVPDAPSGKLDDVTHKALTVSFGDPRFNTALRQEYNATPWYQQSPEEQEDEKAPWGPGDPQMLNRYSYVGNNPLIYDDPTGHGRGRIMPECHCNGGPRGGGAGGLRGGGVPTSGGATGPGAVKALPAPKSAAAQVPNVLPSSGGTFVSTPSGAVVYVPPGYVGGVTNNGKGIVYRPAGSTGDANSIRIMEPTTQYPRGYVRYYNQHGQPINPKTGKPEGKPTTHIPQ